MTHSALCRFAVALGLLLALGWSHAGPALAGSVELCVQPAETGSAPGTRVDLKVRSPGGLGALEVEVVYDPEVLALRDVEEAAVLANGLLEHHLVAPGRLRLALVSSEPITSEGAIAVLAFAVEKPASTTEIGLEGAQAWDHENVFEMRVTTASATLDLESGSTSKLGPTAVAFLVGLAVLILIGIAFARRSRRD